MVGVFSLCFFTDVNFSGRTVWTVLPGVALRKGTKKSKAGEALDEIMGMGLGNGAVSLLC